MNDSYPALQVEGLDEPLEPYEYEEEWNEKEALVIHARVRVSLQLGQALRTLWREADAVGRYFGVVRVDRDDEPRQMRFGEPRWSQHDDHEKYQVVLVDRAYDDEKRTPWPAGPETAKETGLVIRTAEQMETLLSLLVERGGLSQQDVDRARDVPNERLYERILELRRVNDLDDWA